MARAAVVSNLGRLVSPVGRWGRTNHSTSCEPPFFPSWDETFHSLARTARFSGFQLPTTDEWNVLKHSIAVGRLLLGKRSCRGFVCGLLHDFDEVWSRDKASTFKRGSDHEFEKLCRKKLSQYIEFKTGGKVPSWKIYEYDFSAADKFMLSEEARHLTAANNDIFDEYFKSPKPEEQKHIRWLSLAENSIKTLLAFDNQSLKELTVNFMNSVCSAGSFVTNKSVLLTKTFLEEMEL